MCQHIPSHAALHHLTLHAPNTKICNIWQGQDNLILGVKIRDKMNKLLVPNINSSVNNYFVVLLVNWKFFIKKVFIAFKIWLNSSCEVKSLQEIMINTWVCRRGESQQVTGGASGQSQSAATGLHYCPGGESRPHVSWSFYCQQKIRKNIFCCEKVNFLLMIFGCNNVTTTWLL